LHFYYAYFNRYDITDLYWNRSVVGSGSSTGYFIDANGNKIAVGTGSTGNNRFITEGSIIVLSPGAGNYFNSANDVLPLPASGIIPQNGQPYLYTTIMNLVGNGNQGDLSTGQGPVSLSLNIPSGVSITNVIPAFSNSFTTAFISKLIGLISNYTEFGVRYDQTTKNWIVVDAQDLDLANTFSQEYQGSNIGQNLDSSWLLTFTVNGPIYTVQIRGLSYIFESTRETKFYFDDRIKIFDPVTGYTVNDSVNILKVNGYPDTGYPLSENVLWYIYNQIAESDGYVDASKVLVTYSDSNNDGVPDDPDIFTMVVQPDVNTTQKFVFFVKTYGYNSFVSYTPVDNSLINVEYPTQVSIISNINNYAVGQIFYTYQDELFYLLEESSGTRSLTLSNDYLARVGRPGLYFQYKHNAPGSRRIDPSPSNIIDMYILTKEYETEYRTWVLDTSGTAVEPERPNSESLALSFSTLENYKSVSDAIIYNSAKFKPLFGNKSRPELQATFKVVKNSNINLTDSEIRSQVLAFINSFFSSGNWDFGETFYFTELATYIQQGLAPNVSSIIIVPNSTGQTYGSLQQINSEPDEILISSATVENIEVISAITAAQLNLQNSAVNTVIN
jgi:hypothetical protein